MLPLKQPVTTLAVFCLGEMGLEHHRTEVRISRLEVGKVSLARTLPPDNELLKPNEFVGDKKIMNGE
jgi:hypothetical protein